MPLKSKALALELHEPLRNCFASASFGDDLNKFVFEYYQREVLPHINEDDPHTHLGPMPEVAQPSDVEKLFDKANNAMEFLGEGDFNLQLDVLWEEEHGLSLKVRNWKICPR